MTAKDLLALLGNWTADDGSLYRGLARALQDVVERGDLAPGTRLPPERVLAQSLSVSRGTVMNAFELLRQGRLIESRQGSGTRVRFDAPRPLLPDMDMLGGAASSRSLAGRLFDDHPGVLDLAVSMLHDTDAVRRVPLPASWDDVELAGEGHGYAPQGLRALREAVCGYYLDRGLRTTADQVLITGGAQQGLDLCAALALRPGDCVVLESPTYPGAIDAFARHGARIVTIPFSSHWDRRSALRDAVVEHAPRLVYLMPGLHNPTGMVLPDSRRREVARIADEHALYVVEDNTLADVAFRRQDQPLIAAYSKQDRVLTLGSLSKSAWGGLRIGWVRGDRSLVSRLARSKAAKDLSLSPLPQMVAQAVLADFDAVVEPRRAQLAAHAELIQSRLAAELPSWRVSPPDGGLSLWARLPTGDGDEFVQTALRHGVAVIAGSAHCLDGQGAQHLRIAFAHREDVLVEGVRRLATAWDEYASREGRRVDDASVVAFRPRAARTG